RDSPRHARPCAGHPRLCGPTHRKTWMAGTNPAMTNERPARQFRGKSRLFRLKPNLGESGRLPLGHVLDLEALDRLIEQSIEIEFRRQMQKHGTQTNRSAVHEHELAWHGHRSPGLERLMHAKRLLAPIF